MLALNCNCNFVNITKVVYEWRRSSIKTGVMKPRVRLLPEKTRSRLVDGTGGRETPKEEPHGMSLEI